MAALIRMGALIGIGALINKNTFEGGRLFERGAYWKEGAKANHYGTYCRRVMEQEVEVRRPVSRQKKT